jgi:hypothetical protein
MEQNTSIASDRDGSPCGLEGTHYLKLLLRTRASENNFVELCDDKGISATCLTE